MATSDIFQRAARRMLSAFATDRDPDPDDYSVVISALQVLVLATRIADEQRSKDADERRSKELASDAVTETWRMAQTSIEPLEPTALCDSLNRLLSAEGWPSAGAERRALAVPYSSWEDREQVLARLPGQPADRIVRCALERAYENRDLDLVDFLTAWIDLADELDETPKDELVADRLGKTLTDLESTKARLAVYLADCLTEPADLRGS